MINITDVQEYWDRRPCNIRHSLLEVGTLAYFEEVTNRRSIVEPHLIPFAGFGNWKGMSVLEIGCGIGTDAVRFAQGGAIYTGIDLSQNSVSITKQRFDLYGLEGNIFQANAEELSKALGNKKFDLIYSLGVIHHTPNPQKVVDQLKKLFNKEWCH